MLGYFSNFVVRSMTMKTTALLLLSELLFLTCAIAHPIHVTVTNMDFQSDSNRIDYSIRLYYDDFQSLINYKYQTTLDFQNRNRLTSTEQNAILDYISQSFQIIVNKNDILAADFLGWKLENQSVWLFFCTNISGRMKEIGIRNMLLLDLFNDQSNLIILQHRGIEKGLEFNKRNTLQYLFLE
jgi:hypothetical protein